MKTKRLLLFFFAVAFLSMLSPNAFAQQWGRTVTASNDAELQKAAQDPSVSQVVLAAGKYSDLPRFMKEGEILNFSAPQNGGGLVKGSTSGAKCNTGSTQLQSTCYSAGMSTQLEAFDFTTGVGSVVCPSPVEWVTLTAKWYGSNLDLTGADLPLITPDNDTIYLATVTNLKPGAYYVFKFKWTGTTSTTTNTMYVIGNPAITAFLDQSTCNNAPTSITSSITPFYTSPTSTLAYAWTGSGAVFLDNAALETPSFSAITSGTFSLTLTVTETNNITGDIISCLAVDTKEVTVYSAIEPTHTQTNVLCYGNSTGAVDLSVSGGNGPYTYLWSNSATTDDISGLAAGTYTVTVTDINLCTGTTSATITQPAAALAATITSQTNVDCFGNATGSVTVTGTSGTGTAPYEYMIGAGSYSSTNTFGSLAFGSYTVTVKDANGCTVEVPVSITQPTALAATITSQTNVDCFGNATGSVTVSATALSGTSPYTYKIGAGSYTSTNTFATLVAGNYTVTVKDANNCTVEVPVSITQPTALAATITSQTNVDCYGNSTGSVTVTATAGTGTSTYEYKMGAGLYSSSGTFGTLAFGSYTVTVKDAHGCTVDVSVSITQPTALAATITSQTNVDCFGNATGSVTVTATALSGTSPYEYKMGAGSYSSTNTFSLLAFGSYTVTVRDANLCTIDVPVSITQPTALTGSITSQINVLCNGGATGAVTVLGSGGSIPDKSPTGYQYSINGVNYFISGTFTGLTAGVYTVTVKDLHDCTYEVPVTITEPLALAATITAQTDVDCYGNSTGSVTVTATSGTGTAGYEYKIGAGSYSSTNTFGLLVAGSYTVTVKDANGCTVEVPVSITQPTALAATITAQTNVDCFGNSTGSVTVTATSGAGTSPYEYKIGAGSYSSNNIFGTLAFGSYTVTVKDAHGCTVDVSVSITQPTALAATITSQTNVDCFGNATGSVTVTATAGTGTSTYEYKMGAGSYSSTNTFSLLAFGSYTVTVKDAHGCTVEVPVSITQPTALAATITAQTNVDCFGNATGSVTVTATALSGTSPYTYKIGAGSYSSTNTFSSLAFGSYTVTVKDANGCTVEVPVSITQPSALAATITSQTNVDCYGNSTGSVTVTATAGTGTSTYEYAIDAVNYSGSGTFGTLAFGSYTVTVKDAHGCIVNVPVSITQPTILAASISAQSNVDCFGNSSGTVTILATGGTPFPVKISNNYEFSLNGAAYVTNSGIFTGLVAGVYTVTVKDSSDCTVDVSVTITQPTALAGTVTSQTDVACFGTSTGSVTVEATIGTGTSPYEYSFNGGTYSSTHTFGSLAAGTYTITVRDNHLCTVDVSATITQEPDFTVTAPNDVIVCSAANTFDLSDLAGSSTPGPSAGTFYDGATVVTTFVPSAGTKTLTYSWSNALGCTHTDTFTVTVDAMAAVNLEGQVKYWNNVETFMPTPFPTDIYGTTPPDYFYVALYHADTVINVADPLANAINWQKVDQLTTEIEVTPGNWVVNQDFMSYFKFDSLLDPAKSYKMIVWDGSGLYEESQVIGTTTGNSTLDSDLGNAYTWKNWGGVSGIDALAMQMMINASTNMNSTWNWVGNQSYTGPTDWNYGYYSNFIANVNTSGVNLATGGSAAGANITALDALTAQYRIAGLQPTFPNKTPNFRVAGRFVTTLPAATWPTPFTNHNAPIDVQFTKSNFNYQYFTKAVSHYYKSNDFTTASYLKANTTSPSIGSCPDGNFINLYYEATGDVNASYVPPTAGFKAEPAMALAYENEVSVQKGQIIDIPVSLDRSANLGSIDLGLTFRKDLIKVLEVPGFEVVNIDNEKGFVRLSWADVDGRSVSAGEAVVSIKALVLADITADTRVFELEAMTELGDVTATLIEGTNLKTVALSTAKIVGASDLFMNNYPNPFNNKTTISYNLPESGKVTIVVYNNLGSVVKTLVDQNQTEGTHTLELNRADFSAGVYTYRLILKGNDTRTAIRNMVITD